MSPVKAMLVGFVFLLSFAYMVTALAHALGAPTMFAALIGVVAAAGVSWWIARSEAGEG